MNILIPFFILVVFSYSFSINYKISIPKSFLFISLIIILSFLIFGKFNLLEQINYLFYFSSLFLFVYLILKKKINSKYLKNILVLFVIYLILIIFCKDLFLYKFDEFSEYGITTKLIFSENKVPFNIDYLQKGSHHKINLLSYYHYFFLKNSNNIFKESTTLIAHSFFIILLVNFILTFIDINFYKKIIISLSIYFLIYSLGPGFDRLYVDSILGLLIGIIFLLTFKENLKKSDKILIFLILLIIPMIKPNGLLIVFGLLPIFFLYTIYKKNLIPILIIIFALFSNYILTKFYTANIDLTLIDKLIYPNSFKDKNYNNDQTSTFTIKTFRQINNDFVGFDEINKNKEEFIEVQVSELMNKGIYHSKTFLILSKLLKLTKLNYKIINFPINIFLWFLIILITTFFISKNRKGFDVYILSILYIIFICFYYLFLIIWAEHNNLINKDFTLEISWERHLGTLILGIIIFLLINLFKYYKKSIVILSIFVFVTNISPANSLRIFLPSKVVLNEKYWNDKYNQRLLIGNLLKKINQEFDNYTNLVIYLKNIADPYFIPILKYELIKFNTVDIDADNSIHFFDNFKFKKEKLYIMSNEFIDDKKVENIFKNSNLSLNRNLILKRVTNIERFYFYEILEIN